MKSTEIAIQSYIGGLEKSEYNVIPEDSLPVNARTEQSARPVRRNSLDCE